MTSTVQLALRTIEEGIVFEANGAKGMRFLMDSAQEPQGASPVEALLAALGACGGMDVIGILRKKRQEVTGYELVVTGERREDHPRAFTRIEVLHRLRGRNLSADAIEDAIRLSDTKYCTVHATLAPAVELVSRYEIVPETP
jgi:putative redox protein